MKKSLLGTTVEYCLRTLNSVIEFYEVWTRGIEERSAKDHLLMCTKVNKFDEYFENVFRSIVGGF